MTRKQLRKIKDKVKISIVKGMELHKAIIIIFITVLFTMSSCWDGGLGPYESDKGYCEYNKYQDSPSSYCLSVLLLNITNKKNDNKNEALLNACLLVVILEEASCKDESIYKPYWFF